MGIYSALSVGNTGLNASQKALEVVGNNIANAATENYSRQDVILSPGGAVNRGSVRIGTGVRVEQILRRYDAAVESRLCQAASDQQSRQVQQQALDRLESLYNETTDNDLSSALVEFFNSFESLANQPTDAGLRTVVIERARTLVDRVRHLRSGMDGIRREIDESVRSTVEEVNRLAGRVADLNVQVVMAEEGQLGSAPNLRDARSATLRELAQRINFRIVEQESGAVNVLVGNQMLVDGRTHRELTRETVEDRNVGISEVSFADNDAPVALTGGTLQGYITSRDQWIGQQVDGLDRMARTLIFEVNKLHAEGAGTSLPQSVRSEQFVLDSSATLTSEDTGLNRSPQNGSFLLEVTTLRQGENEADPERETFVIDVDLDGIGADDSLDDVVNRINALAGAKATASVDTTGHLVIEGVNEATRVGFADDTSSLLACLGVNALFTGYDSVTMGLSEEVVSAPGLLAAGLSGEGDNANALRLAGLADQSVEELGGSTILDYHTQSATRLAVNTAAAESATRAADAFLSSMQDERESISGVNLDEETVKLIRFQKVYSASARFMGLMSELLDELVKI